MKVFEQLGFELVKECKEACGQILFKAIIETCELKEAYLVKCASEICIDPTTN